MTKLNYTQSPWRSFCQVIWLLSLHCSMWFIPSVLVSISYISDHMQTIFYKSLSPKPHPKLLWPKETASCCQRCRLAVSSGALFVVIMSWMECLGLLEMLNQPVLLLPFWSFLTLGHSLLWWMMTAFEALGLRAECSNLKCLHVWASTLHMSIEKTTVMNKMTCTMGPYNVWRIW